MAKKTTSTSMEILLQARDQTRAGFTSLNTRLDRFDQSRLEAANRFAEQTQRALQRMQSVAAVVGSLNVGVHGASILTQALASDWEQVRESLFRLPLGLGEVSRSLHGLVGTATGWRQETEQAEASMKRMDAITKTMATTAKAVRSHIAGLGRDMKTMLNEELLIGLAPDTASIRKTELEAQASADRIREQTDQQVKAIRDSFTEQRRALAQERTKLMEGVGQGTQILLRKMFEGQDLTGFERRLVERNVDPQAIRDIRSQLRGLAVVERQQTDDLLKARDEGLRQLESLTVKRLDHMNEQIRQRQHKAAADWMADIRQQSADQANELERATREVLGLEHRIDVARLNAAGDTMEAMRLQNRRHYELLIQDAKAAGRDMSASLLQELKQIQDQAITARFKGTTADRQQSQRDLSPRLDSSRFLTGVHGNQSDAIPQRQLETQKTLVGVAKELAKDSRESRRLLERMLSTGFDTGAF
jgi:uncharacterized phage infection (PIP) family protein YhgE